MAVSSLAPREEEGAASGVLLSQLKRSQVSSLQDGLRPLRVAPLETSVQEAATGEASNPSESTLGDDDSLLHRGDLLSRAVAAEAYAQVTKEKETREEQRTTSQLSVLEEEGKEEEAEVERGSSGVAEVEEEDEELEIDDDDEAEDDGRVEYWEGDMGPMTEEEERRLLEEAEAEIAQLEAELGGKAKAGYLVEDAQEIFDEEEEDEEEEEEEEEEGSTEKVAYWEGDLEPLTEEEEEALLKEMEEEIGQLERAAAAENPAAARPDQRAHARHAQQEQQQLEEEEEEEGEGEGVSHRQAATSSSSSALEEELEAMKRRVLELEQQLVQAKQQEGESAAAAVAESARASTGTHSHSGQQQGQVAKDRVAGRAQQEDGEKDEDRWHLDGGDASSSTGPAAAAAGEEGTDEEEEGAMMAEMAAAIARLAKHKRQTNKKKKEGSSSGASQHPEGIAWELEGDDADYDDDDSDGEGGEGRGGGTKERGLPAVMRCFDAAKIYAKAGNGGNGVVAFRREKYVPLGGPSGGNGGRGGHVYVRAHPSLNSLLPFRRSVHFRAGRGSHGQGSKCHGYAGEDTEILVPPGTIIREAPAPGEAEGPVLLELVKAGQRELLLPGGRGGRGNASFKTGRNNAPQWLQLELKLVADVGIIGVPNAGKSTLLSVISAAKPKIANYPFTTLVPNLGVVDLDYETTVFADVPGLLEGAHSGHGLGHEFLRHTERCRVLVHVIDGTRPQPVHDYHAICQELSLFNPAMADKPQVVVFNKVDVPEADARWGEFEAAMAQEGVSALRMSAATGQHTEAVVRAARAVLATLPPAEADLEEDAGDAGLSARAKKQKASVGEMIQMRRAVPLEEFKVDVDRHTRTFYIQGEGLERFIQMTNWEYFEAVKRFQGVLDASGVTQALRSEGIRENDLVVIGQMQFNWHDTNDMSNLGEWKRGTRGTHVWPH
eukprot:jgi/Mesen1/8716/ME000052S08144